MLKYILITIGMLFSCSCSALHVQTAPVEKPKLNIALPPAVQMNRVTVKVIGSNVCYTEAAYKQMLQNLNTLQAYITLLRDVTIQYKSYYEAGDEKP